MAAHSADSMVESWAGPMALRLVEYWVGLRGAGSAVATAGMMAEMMAQRKAV